MTGGGNLAGVRILLGISGGIAAYKTPDLVRRLRDRGAEVQAVLTAGAEKFVTPLSLQAVSGRTVRDSLWDRDAEAAMSHIELARWADQVLIAPASADLIARLAGGHASDLLSTLCLATEAPVAIVPSMNRAMWAHQATQANLHTLSGRGVDVLDPASGAQACGETGPGRMPEPADIAEWLARRRGADALLDGVTVLVTAGPTREPLDPVRYLSNHSSGKMGFAVAQAAREAGARVVLVAGPVSLATPHGVTRLDVETAEQMYATVHEQVADSDIFISTAAVADYRPRTAAQQKMKKSAQPMSLALEPAPDILSSVTALPAPPFSVGFAAETEDVERYARGKLARKRLDMIAANQVGAGLAFGCEDNELILLWEGGREVLSRAPKPELARALVAHIAQRFRECRSKEKSIA